MGKQRAVQCTLCFGTGYWQKPSLMTTADGGTCPACGGHGWYWVWDDG